MFLEGRRPGHCRHIFEGSHSGVGRPAVVPNQRELLGRPDHHAPPTSSCPGDGTTPLHPGPHAAVRRPAVHLPHRLPGHCLRGPHPVPVPLERGAQERDGEQIQARQQGAPRRVPAEKRPYAPGPETRNFPVAPLLGAGTLADRARVIAESAEFVPKSPRQVAVWPDGLRDHHHI